MKIRILILFGWIILISNHISGNKVTDSLFWVLDKAIENRGNYLHTKTQRIEMLSNILHKSANLSYTVQDGIYNDLYNEYSSFNYDSAFSYSLHLLKNAYASKNVLLINKARIKVGFSLLSAGLFKETIDTLYNISLKNLPDTLKLDYYYLLARTYFDMSDFTGDSYYAPLYNTIGKHMLDSALMLCNDGSKKYLKYSGLKYLRSREIKKARLTYERLLKFPDMDLHEYAIEASSLSFIYKFDNEPDLAIQILIKAAIADFMASTKETVAVRQLAEIVYNNGDIERAYKYVKVALEDAHFYGARHRKIQISDILPSIEDRQLEIVQHQRKTFLIYSLSITCLSLLTIVFGIIIFRQVSNLRKAKKYLSFANKRLEESNKRLEEANLIKEEYIGHFFNTISEYIDRFEKLKLYVGRKITTRQMDDIKDIISAIDIRKEREEFYHNFDSIFLKIFPQFMYEFNTFLKDEHIYPDSGQLLTPEVRIYALIRLGFADNEKIAKFLGYSLNTIYSYKTKIKNRLKIPVEEFDRKLMKIRTGN